MEYAFVIEPQAYQSFENDEEQVEQCQEWGLLSGKASKTKTFYYKGHGLNIVCSIVGFVDKMTAVIQLDNDQKHCIHPSYLKEMQAASYGAKHAAGVEADEGSEEAPIAAAEAAQEQSTENGSDEANDDSKDARDSEAGSAKTVEEMLAEAGFAIDSVESAAAIPEAVQEAADEAEQVEDKPKAATKAKKEKAPKLTLPEEKVKMIATVKEFTTVPNHFSDNDDEVVIYEAVSITEPEPATLVGEAWSSHSATLKKQELEIGDIITFEAKIVAKKLTKHPVAYKINNPAKIKKAEA